MSSDHPREEIGWGEGGEEALESKAERVVSDGHDIPVVGLTVDVVVVDKKVVVVSLFIWTKINK